MHGELSQGLFYAEDIQYAGDTGEKKQEAVDAADAVSLVKEFCAYGNRRYEL